MESWKMVCTGRLFDGACRRLCRLAGLVAITSVALHAGAASSCDANPRSDDCSQRLQQAEERLAVIYAKEEERLRQMFDPEYGETSGSFYTNELVESFHDANRSWAKLRDAECLHEQLHGGMTWRYAVVLAEQCKLDRTRTRIKKLATEQLKRQQRVEKWLRDHPDRAVPLHGETASGPASGSASRNGR